MKRTGHLWDRLVSFENLLLAARRTLKGKRSRPEACAFFLHLEGEVLSLQASLEAGTYRPCGYRTFWITDPKPRLISAASFRDRVVHHALVQVIEPVFERRFIHHSYACRTGKGNHRALAEFVRQARRHRYVLKLDVRKFFPSIDHLILKFALRAGLKDARVLALCNRIIDGSNPQEPVILHFPGDSLITPLERRRGIPIGNLTSQFFGNVYLDALDHFVLERLRAGPYLRYVDDLACFGDDKGRLREVRAAIASFLAGLRLKLNAGKSRLRQVGEGIEFLGFVARPDTLRLNARSVRRLRRRQRRQTAELTTGAISQEKVAASFEAWGAHAAQGSTRGLREEVRHRMPGCASAVGREPVFGREVGDGGKVAQVAGGQAGAVAQADGRDPQVGLGHDPARGLELGAELAVDLGGLPVEGQHLEVGPQHALHGLEQPSRGGHAVRAVEQLGGVDGRGGLLLHGQAGQAADQSGGRGAPQQIGQHVGVEDRHASSPSPSGATSRSRTFFRASARMAAISSTPSIPSSAPTAASRP